MCLENGLGGARSCAVAHRSDPWISLTCVCSGVLPVSRASSFEFVSSAMTEDGGEGATGPGAVEDVDWRSGGRKERGKAKEEWRRRRPT